MKAEIKIPDGWEVVNNGEVTEVGDHYLHEGYWVECTNYNIICDQEYTYIRKASDPYAEAKKWHKEERLQFKGFDGTWINAFPHDKMAYCLSPEDYRRKPECTTRPMNKAELSRLHGVVDGYGDYCSIEAVNGIEISISKHGWMKHAEAAQHFTTIDGKR